jgi:hypothetical protein
MRQVESIKASKKRFNMLDDTSIYKEAVSLGLNSFEYGGIFPDMSAPYNAIE